MPHVTEWSNTVKNRNIKKEFNNNYRLIFYWLCVDKHVSQMMCPDEFFAIPCNFLLQPFEINREMRLCLLKIILIYIVSNSDCETAFSLFHMLSMQFKGYPQMFSFLFLRSLSQTDLFHFLSLLNVLLFLIPLCPSSEIIIILQEFPKMSFKEVKQSAPAPLPVPLPAHHFRQICFTWLLWCHDRSINYLTKLTHGQCCWSCMLTLNTASTRLDFQETDGCLNILTDSKIWLK